MMFPTRQPATGFYTAAWTPPVKMGNGPSRSAAVLMNLNTYRTILQTVGNTTVL
jgi:hypothetical protein